MFESPCPVIGRTPFPPLLPAETAASLVGLHDTVEITVGAIRLCRWLLAVHDLTSNEPRVAELSPVTSRCFHVCKVRMRKGCACGMCIRVSGVRGFARVCVYICVCVSVCLRMCAYACLCACDSARCCDVSAVFMLMRMLYSLPSGSRLRRRRTSRVSYDSDPELLKQVNPRNRLACLYRWLYVRPPARLPAYCQGYLRPSRIVMFIPPVYAHLWLRVAGGWQSRRQTRASPVCWNHCSIRLIESSQASG